jgi:hypothetical protein
LLDKPNLLRPSPSLDLLFPIDSVTNVLIALEENKSIALINLCETRNRALSMFLDPTFDAIGHPAVESMGSTSDDINEVMMISFCASQNSVAVKVRTAGPSTTLRSGRDDKG